MVPTREAQAISRHSKRLVVAVALVGLLAVNQVAANRGHNDHVNRKSIVFDLKTPKVFYCPQEKQSDSSKMIVMAKPLDKLCEFEGKPKPKGKPSDCYNDVDETHFACDEKKRFMMRLDLSAEVDSTSEGIDDLDYILTKTSNKKKANPLGKKY